MFTSYNPPWSISILSHCLPVDFTASQPQVQRSPQKALPASAHHDWVLYLRLVGVIACCDSRLTVVYICTWGGRVVTRLQLILLRNMGMSASLLHEQPKLSTDPLSQTFTRPLNAIHSPSLRLCRADLTASKISTEQIIASSTGRSSTPFPH